jgi:hypothetical protein
MLDIVRSWSVQGGQRLLEFKPAAVKLLVNFVASAISAMVADATETI